ncbi:MAG TPA: iron-containing alcohol dehydrogenase [Planctomycetaceae bacterium]|nr:iron-containing alcohol dehydrogenase [Planctomycetaceae bacterium]
MNYTFLAPQQIVFGWGRRAELGRVAAAWGHRAWLLSGSRTLERTGVIDQLAATLFAAGMTVERAQAPGREPEVSDVDQLTDDWMQRGIGEGDVIVAVGGGSTIDLAKAVAAMVTNPQGPSVIDFLEGVGRGLQVLVPPIPMVAVPTTAGTGTEATKNAVISSYQPPFKKSLRSDRMVPKAVVVDPELTVSVPADVTAHTGMDAITQLIESYISKKAAPIPQTLCLEGLRAAIPAIPKACFDGTNRWARESMAHAALLSGMALANSGLGLAHGVAAALGVHCLMPHGLACAVMLPTALRFNLPVCRELYAGLASMLWPQPYLSREAAADMFVERIAELCRVVGIPQRLRELGVLQEQIPALVTASHGNSLSGNPRDVTDDDLRGLLEAVW